MKKLKEEANKWVSENAAWGTREAEAFVAGANSKWVQAEIIKAQIIENGSMLEMLKLHGTISSRVRVSFRIEELKRQLKELIDENT